MSFDPEKSAAYMRRLAARRAAERHASQGRAQLVAEQRVLLSDAGQAPQRPGRGNWKRGRTR